MLQQINVQEVDILGLRFSDGLAQQRLGCVTDCIAADLDSMAVEAPECLHVCELDSKLWRRLGGRSGGAHNQHGLSAGCSHVLDMSEKL